MVRITLLATLAPSYGADMTHIPTPKATASAMLRIAYAHWLMRGNHVTILPSGRAIGALRANRIGGF